MAREPLTPPYTKEDLPELDRRHMRIGLYAEWMLSDARAELAGNQVVRIVNWKNLEELCELSGLNPVNLRAAYKEAVETGDILFVTYEVDNAATASPR